MTTPQPPPLPDEGRPPPGGPPAAVLPYHGPACPAPVSPREPDDEHLRLLALFHSIGGVLMALFGSLFLVHFVIGVCLITNPRFFDLPGPGPGAPPGPALPGFVVGWVFAITGGAAVLWGWFCGAATLYAGRCIRRRRRRTFCLGVAGVNCIYFPVGTALGVFTLVVLLRESVAARFDGTGRDALTPGAR